ncbi:hypothetical protein GJ744_010338 [Endocarpon pusillum]|uniref:Uncharacterized protein n=1 Tax=Endocarpon pusillum TaxID=364733 RepID=A0A8H7AIC5_9EURO|nr:hypothetical protein GJ744_010338 [Endocarpon pusillum]
MLGRLEYTVEEAIEKYGKLANDIFKKEKTFSWKAKYDHKPLERKLKEVISDPASPLKLDENTLLVDNDRPCKSFVVTTNLKNNSVKPVLLRAYETEFEVEPINKTPVKIWEAGRATSAAPTYFRPYKMRTLGYQEAGRLWQGRKIDLILSIGTGPERDLTLSNATKELTPLFWRGVVKVGLALKVTYAFRYQLAMYSLMLLTNTGRTHERVQENIKTFKVQNSGSAAGPTLPRIYFRLNVEDRRALVDLDACDKMDELIKLAKDYMNGRNQKQERDQIATTLLKTKVGDGITLPRARPAEKGNANAVKTLLERGADAGWKDINGRTPLSWAAENGHEAVVKLLLDTSKVDADSKDSKYGRTPQSWAMKNGHEAVVKLLQSSKVM